MPNLVKRLVTAKYDREFSSAEGMVVVAMGGVSVKELEKLRGSMAKQGVKLRMVRNSLATRVLKERGLEFGAGVIAGNVGIAYGDTEATIHAAKLLTTPELKKSGKLALRGGMLEGRVLNPKDTAALADVPDKNTLRAKILGCLQGPGRGLVTLLAANPSAMARVLQARADQAPAEQVPQDPATGSGEAPAAAEAAPN
jgi:large subunit ribosomal protein L10